MDNMTKFSRCDQSSCAVSEESSSSLEQFCPRRARSARPDSTRTSRAPGRPASAEFTSIITQRFRAATVTAGTGCQRTCDEPPAQTSNHVYWARDPCRLGLWGYTKLLETTRPTGWKAPPRLTTPAERRTYPGVDRPPALPTSPDMSPDIVRDILLGIFEHQMRQCLAK